MLLILHIWKHYDPPDKWFWLADKRGDDIITSRDRSALKRKNRWERSYEHPEHRGLKKETKVQSQAPYLKRWPPSEGSAARLCSPPYQEPDAGIWGGEGSRPRPPGREGALGVAPAESAHPARNCWRPGSVAGSQCGKTSGPLSEAGLRCLLLLIKLK